MDSFFDKSRQLGVLLEQYEKHGKIRLDDETEGR